MTPRWAAKCSPLLRVFSPALRRMRREDGFSMVEVAVAIAVFGIVATFMSQMLAGGLKGVLLGKRREVATQEANRLLETARSLSYAGIGLIESDPTIDEDVAAGTIQEHNGSLSYRSESDWEPLMWATTEPSTHPFNPHKSSVKRGSTSLTRYIYVTGVDSDGNTEIDMRRLTVRVTWDESGSSGPVNEVRAQTLVNESGAGQICPAPCTGSNTPLTAEADATAGTIDVKSARGEVTGLINAILPPNPTTFTLPTTSGKTKFRAVSDISCSAKSAEFVGASNTYGGHGASATADDDAQSPTSAQPAADSYTGLPADPINLLDDVDDLLVETALSSPVSCRATANDTDGQPPTDDGLPYEKGTASALGSTSLNLTEDLSGLGLPSDTLTALAVTTAPISQDIDHQIVADQREISANSAATLGLVQVQKIPSVFPEGLVRVDGLNYGASIRAAAGTPSVAPTVTAPSISLRVYDVGNEVSGCSSRSGGYCFITVDVSASGFVGMSIDFEHSVLQNLGLTNLVYEVHVDILPPAKDPIDGVIGPNGEKRWTANYTPITISTRLRSYLSTALGSVLLTDTKADANLGSVSAKGCAGGTCL